MDGRRKLQLALVAVGILFVMVPAPMMIVWPAGWRYQPHNYEYDQMMVGLFATLGLFLLMAARQPEDHLSLIRFTIVSSFVHGATMIVQGIVDDTEHGHLVADAPILFLIAVVLFVLFRGAFAGEAVLPRVRPVVET